MIKWAAGRIAHVDDTVDEKGFVLLRKLCPNGVLPDHLPWHRVWLAGEVLLEMSLAKVTQFEEGPDLVTRLRGLLKQLLVAEALDPVERAQAGMALGRSNGSGPPATPTDATFRGARPTRPTQPATAIASRRGSAPQLPWACFQWGNPSVRRTIWPATPGSGA